MIEFEKLRTTKKTAHRYLFSFARYLNLKIDIFAHPPYWIWLSSPNYYSWRHSGNLVKMISPMFKKRDTLQDISFVKSSWIHIFEKLINYTQLHFKIIKFNDMCLWFPYELSTKTENIIYFCVVFETPFIGDYRILHLVLLKWCIAQQFVVPVYHGVLMGENCFLNFRSLKKTAKK